MLELTNEAVEKYLQQLFGPELRLTGVGELGSLDQQEMKDFGYGKPLELFWEKNGESKSAVLSMMKGDRYGHQEYWDRARILMMQHDTGQRMERHVKPLGLGYADQAGKLFAVQNPQEFFILSEKSQGRDYFRDLYRIREGELRDEDVALAAEFGRWLARIHSEKHTDPDLYVRRVRNLVGDCECIFGIDDGYPYPYEFFPPERFVALEQKLVEWRWKLRQHTDRLCAVHGDFHPWNILVQEGSASPDFRVLDRSRGEWGEAADDVACMTLNYMLFGLYKKPYLSGSFATLFSTLWESYLEASGDTEICKVIAPFYVFRAMVVASPEWYPNHPIEVRKGLFRFVENILQDDIFDWQNVNRYMENA